MSRVRRATLADVPALRALVEAAYRGDSARGGWTHEADLLGDERTSEAELAAAIAATDKRVLVSEADGILTGTVTVASLEQSRAYLGMLCVDPSIQAGGLGRALIEAAESCAMRDFAATTMEMTVIDRRAELIAWYQRRGYRLTSETRPFPVPGDFPFHMVVLERLLV
ncbi:GNAT family N-acetyltransferase [Novosphingobium sp. KCTC 2891]|uniref:GNAT family N-acetyltransferase n=1 Tax=Novosphingobium sp. KCTC 2891 TaxID=2989730 RepID=UPI002222B79B|nr:GNAT family N-acetyltransferase [Novosphingobium sp. KCTC 2891]MCW1384458.1 GNAT family N-acetyltransferase [Novosphingobium sp. KCTC 2891]